MLLLRSTFLAFILFPLFTCYSQNYWPTIKVGAQGIFNFQVEEFIEKSYLSDTVQIALFKKADSNWQRYQKNKKQWIKKRFTKGVKELGHLELLKAEASLSKSAQEFKYFEIDESLIDKTLQSFEAILFKNLAETEQNDKRFGEFLIAQGYPHFQGQTPQKLYQAWKELQRQRIQLEIELKHAKAYQKWRASQKSLSSKYSKQEVNDYISELKSKAQKMLTSRELTDQEVKDILLTNPEFELLLEHVLFLTPNQSSMQDIFSHAPSHYNSIKNKMTQYFNQFDLASFRKLVLDYERKASDLSKKYPDQKTLKKLEDEAMEAYLKKNELKLKTLAQLYRLASSRLKFTTNSINDHAALDFFFSSTIKTLTDKLKQNDFLKNSKSTLPEEIISQFKHPLLHKNQLSDYAKEFCFFALWPFELQLRKFFEEDKKRIQLIFHPEKKLINKTSEFMEFKSYQKDLKRYYQEDLRNSFLVRELQLDLKGDQNYLKGQAAFDFLLDQ